MVWVFGLVFPVLFSSYIVMSCRHIDLLWFSTSCLCLFPVLCLCALVFLRYTHLFYRGSVSLLCLLFYPASNLCAKQSKPAGSSFIFMLIVYVIVVSILLSYSWQGREVLGYNYLTAISTSFRISVFLLHLLQWRSSQTCPFPHPGPEPCGYKAGQIPCQW